ncbi:MAG: FHA domain-containing protein, partial [Bacteroidales bacterium]|nr:FHA domain-containing protein [Bacteroidales bacterium]
MATPWLALKQAREALRTGQPDEARRLLEPLAAEGYRKAIVLIREVARAYLAWAERHLRADDAELAWRNLLAAESLQTGEEAAVRLRHTLTRLGLAQCRAALEAGHPARVLESIARLRERGVQSPEFDVLESASQEWLLASDQADRGDFELAMTSLRHARKRLDSILADGVARFLAELESRRERFQESLARLNAAAEEKRWRDAISWADAVTNVAPDHREARALRARAWEALHTATPIISRADISRADEAEESDSIVPLEVRSPDHAHARPTSPLHAENGPNGVSIGKSRHRPSDSVPLPGSPGLPKRFLLWVDGVGGYLVCLAPRVTFGQATADGPVDVPLFADVSRLHAELTRDQEGYIVESGRDIQINGIPVKRSALKPGDRVTLGVTCQFQLLQPVPISPQSRLE